MHVDATELPAVHACLNWLRDGNNKFATAFYTQYERFVKSCGALHSQLCSVLAEGSGKMRVWFTPQRTRRSRDAPLDDTLQKHDIGLVIVEGHPISYDGTEAL